MKRLPRGFTLLELLIGIALMLALLGTLFTFFHDLINARARVIEITARHRAASVLFDRLERDLIFVIAGDAQGGPGVQGDLTSLRLLTRGVSIHLADRGWDEPRGFSDLQAVEYRFRNGEIEANRASAGTDATPFHSFGARLHRVEFRYHDGRQWRESYDSLEVDALPLAIEVALWFESHEETDAATDVVSEDDEPARRTFEGRGTFDEEAWARRTDRDFTRQPPDRVRVMLIPDARPVDLDAEVGE